MRAPFAARWVVIGVCIVGSSCLAADMAPGAAPSKAVRRLPKYYGKVNLSDAQRFKIYDIQGAYETQLDRLEQQIVQLKEKRDAEVRGVLTLQQQRKLDQLLAGPKGTPDKGLPAQAAPANAGVVPGAVAGGAIAGDVVARQGPPK